MDEEDRPDEQGGDEVCWLHLVCEDCGRLNDRGADACAECGAERPG